MSEAVECGLTHARLARDNTSENHGPYFTVTGVHGIIEAQESQKLASIFQEATLVLPDGMPTVWLGRSLGFRSMTRVYGPEFMWKLIAATEGTEITHFLLGGKEGVAELLIQCIRSKYPNTKISGWYTPPFRSLTDAEESSLLSLLSEKSPHVVWIGLSTPKQEAWMHRWSRLYPKALFVGVGAAFDINSGLVADAPNWMKVSGLQWFHRLLQEPRRLWRRYLYVNPKFIFSIMVRWPRALR